MVIFKRWGIDKLRRELLGRRSLFFIGVGRIRRGFSMEEIVELEFGFVDLGRVEKLFLVEVIYE